MLYKMLKGHSCDQIQVTIRLPHKISEKDWLKDYDQCMIGPEWSESVEELSKESGTIISARVVPEQN